MVIIAYIPLVFALIGLLMFLLSRKNPDIKHVGDVLFWTGVLVTMLTMANRVVHLGRGG